MQFSTSPCASALRGVPRAPQIRKCDVVSRTIARVMPDDVRKREIGEISRMMPDPIEDIFDTTDLSGPRPRADDFFPLLDQDSEGGPSISAADVDSANPRERSICGMHPNASNVWSLGFYTGPSAPDPRFGTIPKVAEGLYGSQSGGMGHLARFKGISAAASPTLEQPVEDENILRPESLPPHLRHRYDDAVAEMRWMVESKQRDLKSKVFLQARRLHNSQMARSWNRYRATNRFAALLDELDEADSRAELDSLSPVPVWVRATLMYERGLPEWNETELQMSKQTARAFELEIEEQQDAEAADVDLSRDPLSDTEGKGETKPEDGINRAFSSALDTDSLLNNFMFDTLPGVSVEDLNRTAADFIKDILGPNGGVEDRMAAVIEEDRMELEEL